MDYQVLQELMVPAAANKPIEFHLLLLFIILPIIAPLLFFELPVILNIIPSWLLKILCFVPAGIAGTFVIKIWMTGDYTLGTMTTLLFGIILYGGFTLKGMIRS